MIYQGGGNESRKDTLPKIVELRDYSQSNSRPKKRKKVATPDSMTTRRVVYTPLDDAFCKRVGAQSVRDRDLKISDKVDFITFKCIRQC